jgi:hypothetical protein
MSFTERLRFKDRVIVSSKDVYDLASYIFELQSSVIGLKSPIRQLHKHIINI